MVHYVLYASQYVIFPVALPDDLRKTKKLGCSNDDIAGTRPDDVAFKTPSSDIVATEDDNSILMYSLIAVGAIILIVGGFVALNKFKKPKDELPIHETTPLQQPDQPQQPQPAPDQPPTDQTQPDQPTQ